MNNDQKTQGINYIYKCVTTTFMLVASSCLESKKCLKKNTGCQEQFNIRFLEQLILFSSLAVQVQQTGNVMFNSSILGLSRMPQKTFLHLDVILKHVELELSRQMQHSQTRLTAYFCFYDLTGSHVSPQKLP